MEFFTHTVTIPSNKCNVSERIADMFEWLKSDTDVRWTATRKPLRSRVTGNLISTSVTFRVNSRDTLDRGEHVRVHGIISQLGGA